MLTFLQPLHIPIFEFEICILVFLDYRVMAAIHNFICLTIPLSLHAYTFPTELIYVIPPQAVVGSSTLSIWGFAEFGGGCCSVYTSSS